VQRISRLALALLWGCSAEEPPPAAADGLELRYRAERRRIHPRDHFPVLDDPGCVPAAEIGGASPRPRDLVIGVEHQGVAKAYPIAVLALHELANDHLAGVPIAVTW
jgi:hypothetical protein